MCVCVDSTAAMVWFGVGAIPAVLAGTLGLLPVGGWVVSDQPQCKPLPGGRYKVWSSGHQGLFVNWAFGTASAQDEASG